MGRIRQWLGLQDTMTVPMMLICFLICFVHCIVRNMKDSLVITAQGGGAEVVPFIQVWMMLPATLLSTLLFTKLASRYTQREALLHRYWCLYRLFHGVYVCPISPTGYFTPPPNSGLLDRRSSKRVSGHDCYDTQLDIFGFLYTR
jgi:hypothetical protein